MKVTRPDDAYVQVDQVEWQDFPSEFHTGGVKWKLLNVSPSTGTWTTMFFCPKGSILSPHIHHGPGEGYIFEGRLRLRGGPDEGGVDCVKDGFLIEATGAKHDETLAAEDTTFILQMVGPLTWKLDDGKEVIQTCFDAADLWDKQTRH